ncbi:asparagine-rich zinc finger protein AZF1-like [Osmia bicornis bicornis]|uniref:asparagine-rich zinc finger protein AZF1-like n=1 Tax=Osmia bicornis bicornis TaxID=1437191 RepID=UPI0010F7324B|nr:asparagine-rich zinc finger protein AZF1-like [Osmia bicornis bicornis]XP_029037597.1 asparagine-rich zinc finger protein AZF1-like [Osmia bicornis bicornis]XP_029037598.1 asparagine-rich zinc finger protein AZF1-like [Osmia bicornis bicornis]
MGQGTDTCTDRPTEVSVIRFVSRNRTIEEIVPKKEIYTCKQRGCGKTFTNQDEYKTHETLEALKIRFICREPGCGEELSDPGSMWRHYQEWHNNETNVFICPYTNCGSLHTTSNNLEEHIENYHRQPPTLPTEPEVICFEDSENVIDEEIVQSTEECYDNRNETFAIKGHHYDDNNEQNIHRNDNVQQQKKEASHDQNTGSDNSNKEDYSSNTESLNETVTFPMNENLMINTENFLPNYEGNTKSSELQTDHSQEKANVVYVNGDITITKNSKNEVCNMNARNQEHRIELDNLERIFRSDLDRDISKTEENTMETNSNCSDDEEYTPKKQRMSRYKQEIYKCAVNGCGRKYKYISHYRHHQDSHKLLTNAISSNSSKSIVKLKQGKASAVSFFLCKIPGCKAQVSNVTGLWKHYQDNHANSKLPVVQEAKSTEVFRCKIPGCETEFSTTVMLYKHFNEVHSNGSGNNASTNTKTGNGSSFHYNEIFKDDTTILQGNFKTDFKAKNNINANDCTKNTDEQRLSSAVKKETRD